MFIDFQYYHDLNIYSYYIMKGGHNMNQNFPGAPMRPGMRPGRPGMGPGRPGMGPGGNRFGGGFLGPFILGGLTGGLVAPFFYGRPNYYYPYQPYPPYYYRPF